MQLIVLLERWTNKIDPGFRFREFDVAHRRWRDLTDYSQEGRQVQGWFCEYPEGVFAVFEGGSKEVFVLWKTELVALSQSMNIRWENKLSGRSFQIIENGITQLRADYRTLRRFLKRPWMLILELVAPDDDWGLTDDLPSFVHSMWSSKRVFHDVLAEWNKKSLDAMSPPGAGCHG